MGGVGIVSYKPSRRIFKYDLTIGPGNVTVTQNLPALDLSYAQALLIQLYLTTTLTDAADSLDFKFQDTRNGVIWNTRARADAVLGNAGASATAPVVHRLNLQNKVDLASNEEYYIETGSTGGTELTAGSVRNGPFPGIRRDPGAGTGGAGPTASWRVQAVISGDANTNASFIGVVTIWAQ